MGFKAGIVGLPNVGKSTLFNSLSNARAVSANFPFCTIEPNIGMVPVPDTRLDKLKELVKPQNLVPAVVKIVDIAGLVKGASKGEGLGNKFLAHIRECEAIIHVLRCFQDENIIHVENTIDPIRDKEIIDTELQLKDMESLEKKLEGARKMSKGGNKDALRQAEIIEKFIDFVGQGKNLRMMDATEEEWEVIADVGAMTAKPVLYVCNVDQDSLISENDFVKRVREEVKKENARVIVISALFEEELAEFEDPEEKMLFLESYGLKEPGLAQVIRQAYDLLNLQTYFTAGVKEVRAWTIHKNTKAPQAAGIIHSDFERGFIRAEVIKFEEFVKYKSEAAVKEAGKMSVEGKEYVVQDGDIMHFRFNV
ncbi:MAG: redox-regulated ATPase YchF [Bacteroidia bacterium]|nr:redox-regulated ATPase YchF [Bacteroidia bacterium]